MEKIEQKGTARDSHLIKYRRFSAKSDSVQLALLGQPITTNNLAISSRIEYETAKESIVRTVIAQYLTPILKPTRNKANEIAVMKDDVPLIYRLNPQVQVLYRVFSAGGFYDGLVDLQQVIRSKADADSLHYLQKIGLVRIDDISQRVTLTDLGASTIWKKKMMIDDFREKVSIYPDMVYDRFGPFVESVSTISQEQETSTTRDSVEATSPVGSVPNKLFRMFTEGSFIP